MSDRRTSLKRAVADRKPLTDALAAIKEPAVSLIGLCGTYLLHPPRPGFPIADIRAELPLQLEILNRLLTTFRLQWTCLFGPEQIGLTFPDAPEKTPLLVQAKDATDRLRAILHELATRWGLTAKKKPDLARWAISETELYALEHSVAMIFNSIEGLETEDLDWIYSSERVYARARGYSGPRAHLFKMDVANKTFSHFEPNNGNPRYLLADPALHAEVKNKVAKLNASKGQRRRNV